MVLFVALLITRRPENVDVEGIMFYPSFLGRVLFDCSLYRVDFSGVRSADV